MSVIRLLAAACAAPAPTRISGFSDRELAKADPAGQVHFPQWAVHKHTVSHRLWRHTDSVVNAPGPGRTDTPEVSWPEWFAAFLADRGTRKPSAHTIKAYC
jgi:hypothetical protein